MEYDGRGNSQGIGEIHCTGLKVSETEFLVVDRWVKSVCIASLEVEIELRLE